MLVGNLEVRIFAKAPAPLYIWMHGAAEDRARPHECDLDGQIIEALGPRSAKHLHLRTALDLKDAGRLRRLDRAIDRVVVVGNAGQVDLLAPHARDLVDAALDRREHPQSEQVDLQKAGVRTRVLVPLHEAAVFHRRRLHGTELDQRLGRDHHATGVLGDVARQAISLHRQLAKRTPPRRLRPALTDRLCKPASKALGISIYLAGAGRPLDLTCR